MTASTHAIEVPGGRLVYDDEGTGPPIVLVHSAIVNRRSWDTMTPYLVKAGYRVIRHDMRGFGDSTTDDVESSPRDDIRAVLDASGAGQAAIVGNSMGAQHALDAVVESPGRFVALVWVGGGISGFDEDETPEEAALFAAASAASDAGDADGEAALDLRIWVDGVGQPQTRVPTALRRAVYAMDRPLLDPGRTFGRIVRLQPPADARLEAVTVPTLAVVGALDTFGTRQSAARLAERVPGARLVTLPDVAHMVGMEAPERLASLVLEQLAPLPRWA